MILFINFYTCNFVASIRACDFINHVPLIQKAGLHLIHISNKWHHIFPETRF